MRGVDGRDPPVLSAALDTLVGVFVERGEVLPELLVFLGDENAGEDGSKLLGEVFEGGGVEFVLVRLGGSDRVQTDRGSHDIP